MSQCTSQWLSLVNHSFILYRFILSQFSVLSINNVILASSLSSLWSLQTDGKIRAESTSLQTKGQKFSLAVSQQGDDLQPRGLCPERGGRPAVRRSGGDALWHAGVRLRGQRPLLTFAAEQRRPSGRWAPPVRGGRPGRWGRSHSDWRHRPCLQSPWRSGRTPPLWRHPPGLWRQLGSLGVSRSGPRLFSTRHLRPQLILFGRPAGPAGAALRWAPGDLFFFERKFQCSMYKIGLNIGFLNTYI